MATNQVTVSAPPDAVYAVLADPHSYEDWLVGCKKIRAVEGEWPAPGSLFHHRVGFGPIELDDNTKAIESDAPRRLVLEARARPLGVAQVVFELEPHAEGTLLTMSETPLRGIAAKIDNPLLDGMVKGRNAESLRRLQKLFERDAADVG